MREIKITVDAQRQASAPRGAGLLCNNSDQVVRFEIDANSGFDLTAPITAIFVTCRGALPDIQFTGGIVNAPVLTYNDGQLVYVGLTQGDIKTSSPAKLDILRSIYSEAHGHEAEPDPGDGSLPIVTTVTLDDLVRISDVEQGRQVLITLGNLAEVLGVGSETAVLYTEQELSENQKAQARENIDAGSTFRAIYGETTPDEIEDALARGKTIVLESDTSPARQCAFDSRKATGPHPIGIITYKFLSAVDAAGTYVVAVLTRTESGSSTVFAWSQTVETAAKASDIPSPSSATPLTDGTASAGSSTDYARGDHTHPTDTSRAAATDLAVKADKVQTVTVSSAGAVTQALDAGKIYKFAGALTSLTITFNATTGLPQYHFIFTEGSTAFDPTLPNGVVLPDSHTWEADTRYEVDILDGYAVIASWAVSV